MRRALGHFRFIMFPLILSLILLGQPLPSFAQDEQITITTYYPSPSGSYFEMNVQGALLIGTGTPDASPDSARIEFSNDGSGRHWNIDQANTGSSNPRLRFFTEPNNNNSGNERLVIDNNNMTFTGTADNGNFILKAPDSDVNDPGDIVFESYSGAQKGRIWANDASATAGLYLSSGNNRPDITIDSNGRVGIGNNPECMGILCGGSAIDPDHNALEYAFTVDGTIDAKDFGPSLTSKLMGGMLGYTAALMFAMPPQWLIVGPAAYGIGLLSSIRFKEKVKPIENALPKLQKLQGVTFVWKGSGKHDIGLIAEEVGKVFPELLIYQEDGKTIEGFNYLGLIGVLVETTKEQQKQIETLKVRISALEKK